MRGNIQRAYLNRTKRIVMILLFLLLFLFIVLTNLFLWLRVIFGAVSFSTVGDQLLSLMKENPTGILWNFFSACIIRALTAMLMIVLFYQIVLYWLKKINNIVYICIYRALYVGSILGACAFLLGKDMTNDDYAKTWYPDETAEVTIWQEGFGDVEGQRIWMIGDESVMVIPIDKELADNDLDVEVDLVVYGTQQKLKVLMDGIVLFDDVLQEDGEIFFSIPGDKISGNIVNLCFEHPDAVSPKQLGQGEDERRLALCIYKVCVKK